MAKQAVGPVIRYLDKAVLAVAAAVFLYAVAMFVVLSPNKAGEPGEEMGPAELDQKVKTSADALRDRLLNYKPSPDDDVDDGQGKAPLPTVSDLQLAASRPLDAAGVPPTLVHRPVPFAPAVPEVVGREVRTVKLVNSIPLEEPITFVHGRSGVAMGSPSELGGPPNKPEGPPEDINWVTVAAMLNVARQESLFDDAGFERDARALVVGVELQRREQLANGEFTEWKTVPAVMPEVPPRAPEITLRGTDSGMVVSDDKQRDEAAAYRDMIENGANQVKLLRPAFFETPYGDPWSPPQSAQFPISRMDRDYGVTDRNLYKLLDDQDDETADMDADDLMKEAKAAQDKEDYQNALRLAELAVQKATGRDKDRAEELVEELKRAKQRADEKAAAERVDYQMVWAHDASAGSIRSGHVYQYRMRPVLLNPYYGRPPLLDDPNEAKRPTLAFPDDGGWSPPSDLVEIEPDTMFFIKSARAERRELTAEVFKWYRGVWLAKQFRLAPGMPIGEEQRVRVPPDDDRVAVDFDTGSRVVDIDFRRPFYERRGRSSELRRKENTAAVVYVDSTGRLAERLEGVDKVDPIYKQRKSEEYESR